MRIFAWASLTLLLPWRLVVAVETRTGNQQVPPNNNTTNHPHVPDTAGTSTFAEPCHDADKDPPSLKMTMKTKEEQLEEIFTKALQEARALLSSSSSSSALGSDRNDDKGSPSSSSNKFLAAKRRQEEALLLKTFLQSVKQSTNAFSLDDPRRLDADSFFTGVLKQFVTFPLLARYADRHIHAVNEIGDDPDCMTRELDLKDPNYNVNEAAYILDKCRLLVIRNVLDPNLIHGGYKQQVKRYLQGFQSGWIDPKLRALYEPTFPTKRYEIMLPKALAHPDLVANGHILQLLQHTKILGENLFLHSLGTVVTEPGAPHQEWHEEDNYLFDTMNSMNDFGIAGHDLPPYTINMFTPLLNLTHDHGPTEFCVGTSHTTGLLGMGWDVYDQSLLSTSQTPFENLFMFHKNVIEDTGQPIACPTRNWRSVLLNVGDVVLFDYQIVHRAGHNLSNDTRAQLYLAYARSWFRDLNYGRNVDASRSRDNKSFLDQLISKTRFAQDVPSSALQGKPDTRLELEPSLEQLRNILEQTHDPFDVAGGDQTQRFVISNQDLDVTVAGQPSEAGAGSNNDDASKNALLLVQVDNQDPQPLVAPGQTQLIEARTGSEFSILDSRTGAKLKTWKVPLNMEALYISKAIVGWKETL